MFEKAQEILLGSLVEPPEFDADEDDLEQRYSEAFYESSKLSIHYSMGTNEFKMVWLTLKNDIQNKSITKQRIFAQQTIDKIFEIYDYKFPFNITLDTDYNINVFYKFLEFLEYDNLSFLTLVWRFLSKENLVKLNIENFCKNNASKVIREIEEQLEIHPQNEIINLFLSGCQKKTLLSWFIKNSTNYKIDIFFNLSEN